MAGTKRDLSAWNVLLTDEFTVTKYTGEDDFGNPTYGDPHKYPCRLDYIVRQRGLGGVGDSQMDLPTKPDTFIICNIYDADVLDRIFVPDYIQPVINVVITEIRDQYGPHHLEIEANFVRV